MKNVARLFCYVSSVGFLFPPLFILLVDVGVVEFGVFALVLVLVLVLVCLVFV